MKPGLTPALSEPLRSDRDQLPQHLRIPLVDPTGPGLPGLMSRGMNGLETRVFELAPEGSLIFTGDGSWWRKRDSEEVRGRLFDFLSIGH